MYCSRCACCGRTRLNQAGKRLEEGGRKEKKDVEEDEEEEQEQEQGREQEQEQEQEKGRE